MSDHHTSRIVLPFLFAAVLFRPGAPLCDEVRSDTSGAGPEATTWHVSPDGSGDAPTIQAAIDAAAAGDTILLASGLFAGEGNRDIDFLGKALVLKSAAGDPPACIIDCEGSSGSPHRGVLFASGEGPGTILEGITVRNGWVSDFGGGILCSSGASPRIVNMVLENNYAGERGGGMFCRWARLDMTGGAFVGNRAGIGGGGAYCRRTKLDMTDVLFDGNEAVSSMAGLGGGMACDSMTTAFLAGVVFHENTALWAGGLSLYLSEAELTGCAFTRNAGTSLCGGLYTSSPTGATTLEDCLFEENTALLAAGAVAVNDADTTIVANCTFHQNEAMHAGAVYFGGNAEVRESVFWENRATSGNGGAAHVMGWSVGFAGCRFVENSADDSGGAVYVALDMADVSLAHCTLVYNTASFGSGLATMQSHCENCVLPVAIENTIIAFGNGPALWLDSSVVEPAITCADIYGNAGGDWTDWFADLGSENGNFSEDPLFCDDFTLDGSSPCLDRPGCGVVGSAGWGCGEVPTRVAISETGLPARATLLPVRPNPFRPSVSIRFVLSEPGSVRLSIYDIAGRLMRTLADGPHRSGALAATWDGRDGAGREVAAGVYFARLVVAGVTATERMILVR